MKLPISDLMDSCSAEAIELHTEIDTDRIKAQTLRRIRPKRRPKLSVLPIAAIIMTLLIGTAVATASAMSGREVEDTAETVWYHHISETDEYQRVYWPNARYAIDLDIAPDAKSQENIVYYRLGWLPAEFEGEALPENTALNQWLPANHQVSIDLAYTDGKFNKSRDLIPYQINISTIQSHEYDYVYYLNGDTTLVKQQNWNGWNRMDLTVDYTNTSGLNALRWKQPVNYIVLYDPVENILVNICGMADLETLEAIAENMEIDVSDEPLNYTPPEKNEFVGSPAQILDLSRG